MEKVVRDGPGGGALALAVAVIGARRRPLPSVEIIRSSELRARLAYGDLNYCGIRVAPGLLRLVDLPDVQALPAPRPLLRDIGAYDARLETDLFPDERAWGGHRSYACFRR